MGQTKSAERQMEISQEKECLFPFFFYFFRILSYCDIYVHGTMDRLHSPMQTLFNIHGESAAPMRNKDEL